MVNNAAPEKASLGSPEKGPEMKLMVRQPQKLQELGQLLETIDNLSQKVSERSGEDISGDLGGSGAATAGTRGGTKTSARDLAIARMASSPVVIQKELTKHVESEIKKLKKDMKKIERATGTGNAFELNELYSKIRRLRSLLREILEASLDVLKKFFIRVFIDRQSIL